MVISSSSRDDDAQLGSPGGLVLGEEKSIHEIIPVAHPGFQAVMSGLLLGG